MSTISVHTGQWTDWSRGPVLGNYRTFSVGGTHYIIGGTAAFVTYVGGCAWLLFAFAIHQRVLANKADYDLITLQQRSIYRNDGTALGAAVDAFWLYWTWKPWKLFRKRPRRAKNLVRRACSVALPALMLFATFAIASVFSSRIAVPAYRTSTVLVADTSAHGSCGIALFENSIDTFPSFDNKAAADTYAAVSYARSCYSPSSVAANAISCNFFATPTLNYTRHEYICPFGSSSTPILDSICGVNGNNAAHQLRTAYLDSNDDLGINAPSHQRLKLQVNLTCSPLSTDGFISHTSGYGVEANLTLTNYNYGDASTNLYTFQYNPAAINDDVPFQVFTLFHNATGRSLWEPQEKISRSDADVTIIFVAPNSITYRDQVIDPFFRATYTVTELITSIGTEVFYMPYEQVSVMGCVEQYSICTDRNHCTIPGGQDGLRAEILNLDLNDAQFVTAQRLIYMIGWANTYTSVNGIGPDALKVWSQVYGLVAPGIPQDQWKIEVEGWFETTLSKWQAFTVEFAANTANLGPKGHLGFPNTNSTLDAVWRHQCANQKISNVGAYQNVSVFGFAFTWTVGGFLILLSWILKPSISQARDLREKTDVQTDQESAEGEKWRPTNLGPRRKARQLAWNIDGKLQQGRLALQSAGYRELKGGTDDVPYLETRSNVPLPLVAEDDITRDTFYRPASMPVPRPAPQTDTGNGHTVSGAATGDGEPEPKDAPMVRVDEDKGHEVHENDDAGPHNVDEEEQLSPSLNVHQSYHPELPMSVNALATTAPSAPPHTVSGTTVVSRKPLASPPASLGPLPPLPGSVSSF